MDYNDPSKTHPEYDEFLPVWKTCRDTVTGQRAISKGGTKYLPKLSGQTDDDFKSYKERAVFFGATGRTVDGMAGLIFRKEPTISLPAALEQYAPDIDMKGTTLEGFARDCVDEALIVGRFGIMIDYPPSAPDVGVMTIEQARQMGQRPYLTMYKAESIINWRSGRFANRQVLLNVWLLEKDGEEDQIRELFFDGFYGQRIWRTDKNDKWVVFEEYYPTKEGQKIEEIPFYFCGKKEGGIDVQNPPIESLAYLNIAHYRNSADLENAVHVAGQPTPWVNGITNPDEIPAIHLGSSTFLKLPPDAIAGFLQCGADGVGALRESMADKVAQMAALGARMLSPEKSQVESAESQQIKRGGENSVLASIAGAVEIVLSYSLKFMADWVGANPEEAVIELNKDYLPAQMDSAMLREWVAAWQSGGFSYDTFVNGLKSGELIPDSIDPQDEIEKMQNETPAIPRTVA